MASAVHEMCQVGTLTTRLQLQFACCLMRMALRYYLSPHTAVATQPSRLDACDGIALQCSMMACS